KQPITPPAGPAAAKIPAGLAEASAEEELSARLLAESPTGAKAGTRTRRLVHAGGPEAEVEEGFRRILASGKSLDQSEIACASPSRRAPVASGTICRPTRAKDWRSARSRRTSWHSGSAGSSTRSQCPTRIG